MDPVKHWGEMAENGAKIGHGRVISLKIWQMQVHAIEEEECADAMEEIKRLCVKMAEFLN